MAQSIIGKKWVDRRGATRTVPMRVLVLGYPRTGTDSMRAALEILGYGDVHHMMCVFANPPEAEMWAEAIRARFFGRGTPYGRAEWDQLLGHCQAITDTPGAIFAADLISAYPDAKVILTNRDPDKWWTSFSQSIGAITASWRYRLAGILAPQAFGRTTALTRLIVSVVAGHVITEEGAKARFVQHYEDVRKLVPKERLLEYEVSQGWGPLCAFLERDVPDVDFPRTNDTQMLHARFNVTMNGIFWRAARRAVLSCSVLAGVALATYLSRRG
ncbi:P-loop containing nucleoside triphosphate hydrolase protein [Mycena vitilis]|nr:P-loop containing nucleoside triphosphate hydrolase protein [Mycena vitilis]